MCAMGAPGAPPGPEWRARDPHPIGEPLLYRTCMRILSSVEDSCGQGSQDRSPPRGDSARAISHSGPGTLTFNGGFRPGLRPLGFPFSPAGGMPNAGLCSGFANSPWKKQNESAGKTKKPSRARKGMSLLPNGGATVLALAILLAVARQSASFTAGGAVPAPPIRYHSAAAGLPLSGRRNVARASPVVALDGQAGDISKCPFASLLGGGQVLHRGLLYRPDALLL
jgi:hypothetical protein